MDVRKRKSKNQEQKTAKELNGRLTPASGALWGAKGDVRSDKFLIECKTTDKNFYSLTCKVWRKIWEEAINDGLRIPVMRIDIRGGSYAIVEHSTVEDFIGEVPTIASIPVNKSFRVKNPVDRFPLPCHYLCEHSDWGNGSLVQMRWEDFLEIADKI